MLPVFQYTNPKTKGDDTRWIAAKSKPEADAAASSRGWFPCGGRVFTAKQMPDSMQGLVDAGVDVIVVS